MLYRNDNTSKYMLHTILKNDRLDMYSKYIHYAIENGYVIDNLYNYKMNRVSGKKYFVLRHDVDHRTIATRKMFELEKELGVTSTYYFRKSTYDEELIHEMERAGFEVGFHFETIAEYMISNNKNYVTANDLNICKEILKKDIREQKQLYNLRSICSHGAPENISIGISNNVLTENENYNEFGICFEAYDRDMYKHIDAHIMDGNIRYGCGFAYTINPIDAINSGMNNIIFLTHPNHWFLKPNEIARNIVAVIMGKWYLEPKNEFNRIAGV